MKNGPPHEHSLRLSVPDAIVDRLTLALRPISERGLRIVMAESCTAGLAAAAISGVAGLGHVLECGFVVYSNEAKSRLLGVPQSVLDRDGAVSEATARLMAEGALKRAQASISISITGFAGPAGDGDEEGLVHFALARSGIETVWRCEHFGQRGTDGVRLAALDVVIDLLEIAGAEE
jgi:nicotinamide-nucleotide amidase